MQIKIQTPCSANWKDMSLQAQGRFCKSCDKVVYDFTQFTDQQLIDWIHQHQKVCGRLHRTQLDRALVPRHTKTSWAWVGKSLLVISSLILTSLGKDAKAKFTRPATEQHPLFKSPDSSPKFATQDSIKIIKGLVFDKQDKLPLPGALITIPGSNQSVLTNQNGAFKLAVPEDYGHRVVTVQVSLVGYETSSMNVDLRQKNTVEIRLESSPMILGEMAIVTCQKKGIINRAKDFIRKFNPLPVRDR